MHDNVETTDRQNYLVIGVENTTKAARSIKTKPAFEQSN